MHRLNCGRIEHWSTVIDTSEFPATLAHPAAPNRSPIPVARLGWRLLPAAQCLLVRLNGISIASGKFLPQAPLGPTVLSEPNRVVSSRV